MDWKYFSLSCISSSKRGHEPLVFQRSFRKVFSPDRKRNGFPSLRWSSRFHTILAIEKLGIDRQTLAVAAEFSQHSPFRVCRPAFEAAEMNCNKTLSELLLTPPCSPCQTEKPSLLTSNLQNSTLVSTYVASRRLKRKLKAARQGMANSSQNAGRRDERPQARRNLSDLQLELLAKSLANGIASRLERHIVDGLINGLGTSNTQAVTAPNGSVERAVQQNVVSANTHTSNMGE